VVGTTKGRIGKRPWHTCQTTLFNLYPKDLSIVLCLITKSPVEYFEDPFNAGTGLLHLLFFKISLWDKDIYLKNLSRAVGPHFTIAWHTCLRLMKEQAHTM